MKPQKTQTPAKTRGVLVRLDPALHRRLKHVAADRDATLLNLARKWIAEGVERAERDGA
jgi:hypothetical protein